MVMVDHPSWARDPDFTRRVVHGAFWVAESTLGQVLTGWRFTKDDLAWRCRRTHIALLPLRVRLLKQRLESTVAACVIRAGYLLNGTDLIIVNTGLNPMLIG